MYGRVELADRARDVRQVWVSLFTEDYIRRIIVIFVERHAIGLA